MNQDAPDHQARDEYVFQLLRILFSFEVSFTACTCVDMVLLQDCEPMINIAKINISRYFIYACIVTTFIDVIQGQGIKLLITSSVLSLCLTVCSVY